MRFNLTDNVVVRALTKICDMVCLNVLWLICCIPIVTIGAATTALYTIMLKMVKNEEGYIFGDFLRHSNLISSRARSYGSLYSYWVLYVRSITE